MAITTLKGVTILLYSISFCVAFYLSGGVSELQHASCLYDQNLLVLLPLGFNRDHFCDLWGFNMHSS